MRRWLVITMLVGCPGQKEDLNGPSCEETATVVALDEVTALGFAAQELLTLAAGTHDETLTWARDESTTPLVVAVTHDQGEVRFVDSEPVEPEGGEQLDIAVICDDRVEIDVRMGLTTSDAALAEAFDAILVGYQADRAEVFQELDPDDLSGSYDIDVDNPESDYDTLSMHLRAAFDASGTSGEVMGQVTGEEECTGNTCTAWAAEFAIGTWGSEGQ